MLTSRSMSCLALLGLVGFGPCDGGDGGGGQGAAGGAPSGGAGTAGAASVAGEGGAGPTGGGGHGVAFEAIWSRRFGDVEIQETHDIAVEASGSAVIVGTFNTISGAGASATSAGATISRRWCRPGQEICS
ncbi:hypothetical protein WME94_20505 [Sorangium sp. So ce429]